jgi:predicted nuclease of predicted toxin-antitoxin system
MKILLDNCVPRRYSKLLQGWGHQAELLSTHISPASPDPDVIKLATTLDAVLLTVDLDFSNIIDYPPKDFEGIIVMRYAIVDEAKLDTSLKTMLSDLSRDDLRGTLVIVTPQRYRIRR